MLAALKKKLKKKEHKPTVDRYVRDGLRVEQSTLCCSQSGFQNLREFSEYLQKHQIDVTAIKTLDISENQIQHLSNDDIKWLFTKFPNLVSLRLEGNPLSEASILNLLGKLPVRLKSLSLFNTLLSDKILFKIAEILPTSNLETLFIVGRNKQFEMTIEAVDACSEALAQSCVVRCDLADIGLRTTTSSVSYRSISFGDEEFSTQPHWEKLRNKIKQTIKANREKVMALLDAIENDCPLSELKMLAKACALNFHTFGYEYRVFPEYDSDKVLMYHPLICAVRKANVDFVHWWLSSSWTVDWSINDEGIAKANVIEKAIEEALALQEKFILVILQECNLKGFGIQEQELRYGLETGKYSVSFTPEIFSILEGHHYFKLANNLIEILNYLQNGVQPKQSYQVIQKKTTPVLSPPPIPPRPDLHVGTKIALLKMARIDEEEGDDEETHVIERDPTGSSSDRTTPFTIPSLPLTKALLLQQQGSQVSTARSDASSQCSVLTFTQESDFPQCMTYSQFRKLRQSKRMGSKIEGYVQTFCSMLSLMVDEAQMSLNQGQYQSRSGNKFSKVAKVMAGLAEFMPIGSELLKLCVGSIEQFNLEPARKMRNFLSWFSTYSVDQLRLILARLLVTLKKDKILLIDPSQSHLQSVLNFLKQSVDHRLVLVEDELDAFATADATLVLSVMLNNKAPRKHPNELISDLLNMVSVALNPQKLSRAKVGVKSS